MALNDPALVIGATSIRNAVTHLQLHNGAPGAGFTANVVGTRAAVSGGGVDADGDITWTASFTGLTASQAVTHISYWSAITTGTNYGGGAVTTGDLAANAAGAYNATAVETSTAT